MSSNKFKLFNFQSRQNWLGLLFALLARVSRNYSAINNFNKFSKTGPICVRYYIIFRSILPKKVCRISENVQNESFKNVTTKNGVISSPENFTFWGLQVGEN